MSEAQPEMTEAEKAAQKKQATDSAVIQLATFAAQQASLYGDDPRIKEIEQVTAKHAAQSLQALLVLNGQLQGQLAQQNRPQVVDRQEYVAQQRDAGQKYLKTLMDQVTEDSKTDSELRAVLLELLRSKINEVKTSGP